jgi:hypothetical protein
MEIKAIEEKPELMNCVPFLREDCAKIMVCCMYEDGKIHYILPDKGTVFRFINDLIGIVKEDGWDKAVTNFENQRIKPLIDEQEFKL